MRTEGRLRRIWTWDLESGYGEEIWIWAIDIDMVRGLDGVEVWTWSLDLGI